MKKQLIFALLLSSTTSYAYDFNIPETDYCGGDTDCLKLETTLVENQEFLKLNYNGAIDEAANRNLPVTKNKWGQMFRDTQEAWVKFTKLKCALVLIENGGKTKLPRHNKAAYMSSLDCINSAIKSRSNYILVNYIAPTNDDAHSSSHP